MGTRFVTILPPGPIVYSTVIHIDLQIKKLNITLDNGLIQQIQNAFIM